MTSESDGQLLCRFASTGDQSAFAEIIRRHAGMVLRLCRRVGGGDVHGAEDATQHVFLALASRADTLKSRESVAGWLYRTSWHVASKQRRERGVRAGHEQNAGSYRFAQAEAQTPADGVPFAVISSELSDALTRALATLPEAYRNAIVLHHIAGNTVEETAQILGVKTGTAASWLSRGRAMLRDKLDHLAPSVAADVVGVWLASQSCTTGDAIACGSVDVAVRNVAFSIAAPSVGSFSGVYGMGGVGVAAGGGGTGGAVAATAPAIGTFVGVGLSRPLTAAFSTLLFGTSMAAGAAVHDPAAVKDAAQAIASALKKDAPEKERKPVGSPRRKLPDVSRADTGSTAIPEPSSAAIMMVTAGFLLARRRRRS